MSKDKKYSIDELDESLVKYRFHKSAVLNLEQAISVQKGKLQQLHLEHENESKQLERERRKIYGIVNDLDKT